MKVEIIEGRLRALGDAVTRNGREGAMTEYTYVELEDGTILKKLHCKGGVNGHLRHALSSDETVRLHVASGTLPNKAPALLAIQRQDGRTFAVSQEPIPGGGIAVVVLFVFGVFLLPIFGLGLLLWAAAFDGWKKTSVASDVRSYVQGLPGAIEI